MTESADSLAFLNEITSHEIPSVEEKATLEKSNQIEKEILSVSGSSDDEDESDKQLTIADLYDDEEQLKDNNDLQQEGLPQEQSIEREAEFKGSAKLRETENNNSTENDTSLLHKLTEGENDKEEIRKKLESEVPKLNGNHSMCIGDEDDNSCSSSSSSTSSHNLVIDHPLAEESYLAKVTVVADENGSSLETEGKSLKRKLSACENDSPQNKQIHLDTDSSNQQKEEEDPPIMDEVQAVRDQEVPDEHREMEEPKPIASSTEETTSKTSSPYKIYVPPSSRSLPSPELNFDCFKCKNAVFDTFTQLRDHHKVCLFKDNNRKVPHSSDLAPACQDKGTLALTQPSEPPNPAVAPMKKRFYLCSSCGTYHENWNLFLHIREIHNRHVCLYCIRLFPTAEKLSLHLEIKHDLEQNHFNSEEKLRNISKGDGNSRFLMCCTCQHVFSEHERFSDHICTEYMQPCSLCSQKGRHLNNCKANPEKRSKVKKKSKAVVTATVTKAKIQPTKSAPACDNKNIINNQTVLSTLPLSLQPINQHPIPYEFPKQNGFSESVFAEPPAQKQPEDYNYHSDDSTNMVIDETCNSNHSYVNEMTGVNPFKALDERERLQEELRKVAGTKTTLPPDRVPEAIPEPKPLIVPKMKLRVPKEFQKAVESEISSTDSDCDEDVEEYEEEQNPEIAPEIFLNASNANEDVSDNDIGSIDDRENIQEWDESNSNLDRILKEIEKTKLDIQRTKEMLEPMNNMKRIPPEDKMPNSDARPACSSPQLTEEPISPTMLIKTETETENVMNWDTPERGMLTPTPPPTPSSTWPSPVYPSEVSPAVLRAVSERENIENMEKESEQAKEQSSALDKSMELDIGSVPVQEESTLDIEEKANSRRNSTAESCQHSSPRLSTDFTPIETLDQPSEVQMDDETPKKEQPSDGIEMADEDVQITDLLLDRPIEKFEIVEFVRLCVKAVFSLCLYCNHARRIAVNGHSLVLHLLAQHRFAATVDSITAEELLPTTIVAKLKSFLPDLEEHYFNLESYCSMPPKQINSIACDERIFECFQCRFSTKMHKDLYLHNRKMHLKTAILCFMCRANFFSFSEILCHICPGLPNKNTVFDIKFRCCLCDIDGILSPFRLMVHLRKKHFACDICLEDCREQGKLSSHVWKHKLHHLCYRCGIAYRNKMDITKHLFWKHGTESIICKRCLQKRWRHVYHFCVPPSSFVCELCNLCFSKATYLKVHKRLHTGDFRYPCTEDNCEEKFISRKLLLKHAATHTPIEVKVEEKDASEADIKKPVEDIVKAEDAPKDETIFSEHTDEKVDIPKVADKEEAEKGMQQVSKRKRKKNRNKESLEDLNLIAPNLSESDSNEESDDDNLKTEDKDTMVPNVMLSPLSEEDKDEERESSKQIDKDTGKIMDIWENFKSFQASQQLKQDEDDTDTLSESNYPTPILHVACSDHDYCAMYKIRSRATIEIPVEQAQVDIMQETEGDATNARDKSTSPSKKKRKSAGSGSSSSDSSSGSDSSCSCGSNCSCSTSGTSSNSSTSSDDDSDSSTSKGRRRIAEKKRERADRNRFKSESSLKNSLSETIDVVIDDKEPIAGPEVKEHINPLLIESDLETAESETDEDFYDEHPQKLASEMLAQKRLQLRAQMRLSPSHNFDIMENSRPSTPSLPEEMVKEKKVKLKKKKRDRKSTSKSQAVPPIKLNLTVNKVDVITTEPEVHPRTLKVPEVDLIPPYDLIASPGVAEPPVAQQPLTLPPLQNNTVKPVPFFHSRMSEGSSCSDADNSLKRSKRARRPNKFYGYTSDDENLPGTPLLIGTRTFKPQPPPQLTWRKEDLPAPSKSILLNKQPRSPRTPKPTAGQSGPAKKRVHQKASAKKKQTRLPPIPTLKIRPSTIGITPLVPVPLPTPPSLPPSVNHTYSSGRDDSDDSDSSDDDLEISANTPATPIAPLSLSPSRPAVNFMEPSLPLPPPPPPPTPQASVFNQKIPPALLPNPDFNTIQYFKRNNIRYPIRPPAGARQPRDGESVYCYCRCPYDEVSEMIACDGENCIIEWFHFECVGIMVAPQGKWFCAECRPKYSNELYPKL